MGKLVYSMLVSADGFVNSADGTFDWADPDDDVLEFITKRQSMVSASLYGRRYYETMVGWTNLRAAPGLKELDYLFSDQWSATAKYVFSRTLESVDSPNTFLRSHIDFDEIRALKAAGEKHITVEGTHIAHACLAEGIVDGISAYVVPIATGGGAPFFPPGLPLRLSLVDEVRFPSGIVNLRWNVGN